MQLPPIGALLMVIAGLLGSAVMATTAPPASTAAAASAPASNALPHVSMSVRERYRPKVVEHYVDINSAGRKELMTLPGIGAAEADKIIANRPYLTKTELVTKGVLPTGPFLSLKHQVVAMQKLPKTNNKGKS